MAIVYILYSKKMDRYYTGSCLDLEIRMIEHRDRTFKDSYTSKADDWELVFSIENLSYESARKVEAHIKKMKSKKYIENIKMYPELREKLVRRFQ